MNIKIREGSGVTELTENKGDWKIKRNGAKIDEEKLKAIIEVLKR